jgi:molybdopterin-binding protein
VIVLDRLAARAGRFEIRDVSVAVMEGTWTVLLGPAGAGKTTLLETIAGVRPAAAGRIALRGVDATALPAEQRRVGMVYQHAYLFPHLSVWRNIAYGGTDERARQAASLVGVESLFDRAVASLSGGERQLVALARALAAQPDILLLDEPFAALDPRRRMRVRADLKRLQRESGLTVIQVTHDFVEAGLLADLAVVIDGGRVQQADQPDALFRAPATAAIADFIGIENVFRGEIALADASQGDDAASLRFTGEGLSLYAVGPRTEGPGHAVIRAEDVTLATTDVATSARNSLVGVVEEVAIDGVLARVSLRVGATTLMALVTKASATELGLAPGRPLTATIKATNVHLC